MAHPFLRAWSEWRAVFPPYFLPEDRQALSLLSQTKRNCHTSWGRYIRHHDFSADKDGALHLGLLPQPFFGNLSKARVVVLSLNRGVGPEDYYGEYRDPVLRQALLASYRQPNHRSEEHTSELQSLAYL